MQKFISRIDHLVLTVSDIEATCNFYSRVLGMEVATFGENRKSLKFGEQKINLHQVGKEFEPKALYPKSGSADICFISSKPLSQIKKHIISSGVDILAGPVNRTGATGTIESIYLQDLDGNLLEISNYRNT
ncbi:lactoylglutathione lyase-like lyase [Rivularia sp. PCC 7116]|uniref:VOC family protein n=1 Tax=Rivularia sp. PCC 7116 TaxID=373994 RepID=UPI00029F04D1|nr:VOC family protein [Rivularia sp. PCC 7116]AFY53784.1 lactoylglutathione lyase-like lyase [Rivularia sp. PCC 7116]